MSDSLPFDLFAELEARQDELIVQLDRLNDQIEAALLEFAPAPRIEDTEEITFRKAS